MIALKTKKIFTSATVLLTCLFVIFSPSLSTAEMNKPAFYPLQSNNPSSHFQNVPTILEIISQINETTLEHYITLIQGFGPHPTGSKTLDHLKGYLSEELMSTGLEVGLDHWRYKNHYGDNIEATVPGTGSAHNIVIITAHYDSISISLGADDDGSGVASILTIAQVMSHYRFNSTIKFVLFSGEEQGLLGSHEYAQEARKHNENIIGVLNLDGVGYAASAEDGTKVWNFADDNAAWMVRITRELGKDYPELIDLKVMSRANLPISDHQSFIDNGYVTDCFLEGRINPFYHTSDDLISHMNITYLTKICRLAAGTLTSIAQLNRILTDNDITIRVRGSLLSHPSLFMVQIENKKYHHDTANLTIHVELKNLHTGNYLTTPYNSSTNWTLLKEVRKSWEFKVDMQNYKTHLISFSVTVEGFNDDIGIYKKAMTSGVILPYFLVVIPRSF